MKKLKLIKLLFTLGLISIITTSFSVLQIINLGDYIPAFLIWLFGIIQTLLTAGFIWVFKTISNMKTFMTTQSEINKHNEETHKIAVEVYKITLELKGTVDQMNKNKK
ncbi:MAG: hypothetical protein NTV32_09850 [Gammaproteobacteria bacterium]|nr:hypothetical protein [Gammaproteobacteria bacterium]